jgi:branched-chain amino acid aminotransferase
VLHPHILHNDKILNANDRLLAPSQVGLLTGWGVFTTMRVAEGVLFAWDRHWARMARDAAAFHVAMPEDPERLHRQLLDLVEANRAYNSTLRLDIVRNGGGMWANPSPERAVDVIAFTADSKEWGEGVRLAYQPNARYAAGPFSGTKILSWSMNLTWLENAQCRGFDEVILLNEHGEVAECTSANLFMANGNEVWTPPLSAGGLPGITREVLLGEVHVPGMRIVEKAVKPADLEAADEVFITSTTRDLLPVIEIEGKQLKRGSHAREALQKAFSTYVRKYIEENKRVKV